MSTGPYPVVISKLKFRFDSLRNSFNFLKQISEKNKLKLITVKLPWGSIGPAQVSHNPSHCKIKN